MHVVVAVDSFRGRPIKTVELVELGRHEILKSPDKSWVKHGAGNAAFRQMPSDFLLTFGELGRAAWSRKRRRKVEMQASVDSLFSRHRCGPFRILREYHGAD